MSRFNWDNIPLPLQKERRWAVYKAGPIGTHGQSECWVVPGTRTKFKANDLSTALSYNKACAYASSLNAQHCSEDFGLAYIVGPEHIVLDFDKTEESSLDPKIKSEQYRLMKEMPTWIEKSSSGTGYHAWYASGGRGSATTRLDDLELDIKGANSFIYMTGNVVTANGGLLSLAGDFVAKVLEHALEKRDFVKSAIAWQEESYSDEELFERYAKERPEQLDFLRTSQEQTGIGEQRFAALKDLIVRSMNYEQIERIYLQAPACSHSNKSSKRGSTDKSEDGYKDYLRREIMRAAHELRMSGHFNKQMQFGLKVPGEPTEPVDVSKLAVAAPTEEYRYPPLFGVAAKAQESFDLLGACAPDLSVMSTLSFLALACGRNYATRGFDFDYDKWGINNSLNFLSVDFLVVAGSKSGKSTSIERFGKFGKYIPADMIAAKMWWSTDRSTQFSPKSLSSKVLHSKVTAKPDGVLLHLDEIGMILEASGQMGGLEGWINSINNARQVGGILRAPEFTDGKNNLSAVEDPVLSLIATGVPSSIAKEIKKNSRVDGGFLSRFVIILANPMPEKPKEGRRRASFNAQAVEEIELNREFMVWLNKVTFKRDKPIEIRWDSSITDELLERVKEVAEFNDDFKLTIPFNRYDDYTIKLSGLMAVTINPDDPVHTGKTIEWALEYTKAARGGAAAFMNFHSQPGTVKRSELEDVEPSEVSDRIYKMVSQFISDKREGTEAHTKRIQYYLKQGRKAYIAALEANAVDLSCISINKNTLGCSKVGSNLKAILNEAVDIGIKDGRLNVILVNGRKAIQALALE